VTHDELCLWAVRHAMVLIDTGDYNELCAVVAANVAGSADFDRALAEFSG